MSSGSFTRHIEEEARLMILTELYRQSDGRLNDLLLAGSLTAYGLDRTREWVRTQVRKLGELGAVVLTDMDTVLIAQITKAGVDHVLRRSRIEGVKQPAPGV